MDAEFQIIEEETEKNDEEKNGNKQNIQEAFVTGLPDWDLEPLYEPLKRGNNK